MLSKKADEILKLLKSGMSYADVGKQFGVSRQRIEQIKQKYFPDLQKHEYGKAVLKQKKLLEKQENWGRNVWALSEEERAKRFRFRRKRENSKKTGYEWELEYDDIIWPVYCPILELKIDYFAENRQENSPSFDRLDSSKGYIKGNVNIISWRANRIKNDGTLEEHQKIVEYLKKMSKESG